VILRGVLSFDDQPRHAAPSHSMNSFFRLPSAKSKSADELDAQADHLVGDLALSRG
jgi:hypothetical protein